MRVDSIHHDGGGLAGILKSFEPIVLTVWAVGDC
jgi:hypothetical protein